MRRSLALLTCLGLLVTACGDAGSSTTTVPPQVAVSGQVLPRFGGDSAADPALGSQAPELSGASFDGTPVAVSHDGRPKAVLFLAHWCDHCRNEVPAVQAWLDDGGMPVEVDLVSVATSNDPTRPNYPPRDWLEGEGWTVPVIVDTAAGDAAVAYGLPAFPYWVFLTGDGVVIGRVAGGIDIESLDLVFDQLATY